MNGSHLVKISRRRGTKYTFTIKRNITIVRGDSGTGKTTLFDMVADYMRTGEQSGVSLQCDCPCVALTDYDWRNQLSSVHDSIVFVDEGLKETSGRTCSSTSRSSRKLFSDFDIFSVSPVSALAICSMPECIQ